MKTIRWPLMTSLLVLTVACGKAEKTGRATPYHEELKSDGSNITGSYSAILYPMNINLHAPNAGMATITRDGDELTAKVKLNVGAKGASYRQAIYWGSRCPGMEADANKDGYLDMPEIEMALGDAIIPLDGDLDTQSGGTGMYPSGENVRGSFFYKRTASFSRFFEDLKAPDPNTHDRVRKLEDQAGFTFLGKIILVQGATADYKIPDTVSSYYGLSRVNSLPVACGVYFKSSDVLPDEAETMMVNNGEPADSPDRPTPTPDVGPQPAPTDPNPDVTPAPNPAPDTTTHPHPNPAPAPTSNNNNDDDNDGNVIDNIRNWWNHVIGHGGGGGH